MKPRIVYKVVNLDRTSRFADGQYQLKYEKDTIVHEVPGTLGIMCFKTKEDVKRFVGFGTQVMILKVRGIGKPSIPKFVAVPKWSRRICDILFDFYCETSPPPDECEAPEGTICFKQVEVLE